MTSDDLLVIGNYTTPMLQIAPISFKQYPRLNLQGVRATAWIEHRSWHLRGVDWQLWIERKGRMTSVKCPLRLEVESRLRAWLLRVSGMPLATLTYTELRLIAEGKIHEAHQLHIRGRDTLITGWSRHRHQEFLGINLI